MTVNQNVKGFLIIILIVAVMFLQYVWDLSAYFQPGQIRIWLADAGIWAPLVYMVVMAVAVVFSPIPSLPLDIAAGSFFGPVTGTIYSVIGALGGAVVSFLIARFLGRNFIERFLGGHVNFCSSCSDKLLTKIVFLSRLIPVVSFDIISYGAGLTKMSLGKFTIATFFGMIPLTFLYNYSGAVLVFGSVLTTVLGIIMVVLFFALPKWMESKGFMDKFKHE
jgi:uncharacterized membrane protein YdjX (TVP38/TMEM64 family)